MNLQPLTNQILLGLSSMCLMSTVQAGIPVWSFSPIGSPVVSVSATGTATVQYTITNNSKKPHRLVLSSRTPAGISQSGGPCVLAAKSLATPNPTCTLTLSINGSALPANSIEGGPFLCQANPDGTPNANQCYQPDLNDVLVITRTTAPGATTLSTSVPPPSILALSVNNTGLNAALTGHARYITIQNTGTNPATGLSVSASGLPTGTNITTVPTTCTGTLAPSATCTVTITPGSNATSNCSNTGIAPTPGVITVSATNVATAVTSNVVVLSYGCQYQGGFLYSVDDSTANTSSIGGKVASLVDQAAPLINSGSQPTSIIWSSNGAGGSTVDVSNDIIPLISESSTPNDSYANAQTTFNATYSNESTFPFPASSAFATCSGASDGRCNSNNILAFYNNYNTGYGIGSSPYSLSAGPTGSTNYASGLCTTTINNYSDWYLPAICEMDAFNGNFTCPVGTQSMLNGLSFLLGDPGAPTPSTSCAPPSGTDCLAGNYWSSTEYAFNPQPFAWNEYFSTGGGAQYYGYKYVPLGVRCSRALTF
jgi:hypothetical protein